MYKFLIIFGLLISMKSFGSELPFSPNDLSILFPIKDANSMRYDIPVDSQKVKVLPLKNFKQILVEAKTQNVFVNSALENPKNWQLVALRYTPCNLMKGHSPACIEQLRFVFQPMNTLQYKDGVDDYAMHVIYEYTKEEKPELSPILEGFRNLKNKFNENLDKTLQLNPVLLGKKGLEYLEMLNSEVIRKNVSSRSPSKVTFMGLEVSSYNSSQEDPHRWAFFSGDINLKGDWKLTLLPTSRKHKVQVLSFSEEGVINSNIKKPLSEFSLFGKDDFSGDGLAILDMQKSNDHNTDCASCHIADRRVFPRFDLDQEVAFRNFWSVSKSFRRLSDVVVDQHLRAGQTLSEGPIPRVFGYLHTSPIVSQRVVWDTSYAVKMANELTNLQTKSQCMKNEQTRTEVLICSFISGKNIDRCIQEQCGGQ